MQMQNATAPCLASSQGLELCFEMLESVRGHGL
jgi:hypothetical protein